jgi:hypothetical protein
LTQTLPTLGLTALFSAGALIQARAMRTAWLQLCTSFRSRSAAGHYPGNALVQ